MVDRPSLPIVILRTLLQIRLLYAGGEANAALLLLRRPC